MTDSVTQHRTNLAHPLSRQLTPDWVMVGGSSPTRPGFVRLCASKELSQAELTVAMVRERTPHEWGPVVSSKTAIQVTIDRPESITIIEAPDWPTAFEALFRGWYPDSAPARIEGGSAP